MVERGLDAPVDEVEVAPVGRSPGVTRLVRHDDDRRVDRRVLGPRLLAGSNTRLALTDATGRPSTHCPPNGQPALGGPGIGGLSVRGQPVIPSTRGR
jgi:hypothetical protein